MTTHFLKRNLMKESPGYEFESESYGAPPKFGCYTKTQLLIQCVIIFCTHSDFAFKRPVTKICRKNSQEANDHPVPRNET